MPFSNSYQAGKSIVQVSSTLPKHILVGYWHNWQSEPAGFVPLRAVVRHFDVINIAFATASGREGKFVFVPYPGSAELKSDIRYLQAIGKKILISIGGATGSTAIDTRTAQANFSESISEIVERYGFDGIDINLEGALTLDQGDTDFSHPTSPSIVHLIAAIREIRNNFGPDFLLSLAPEIVNVQGGLSCYAGFSGSYLPVIHDLRDILTYVQVQHYNSEARLARDLHTYEAGTTDFHAAMAEMLLQGFPVQGDGGFPFPPLRPEQVVIGAAARPEAVQDGYTSPLEMGKALNYLARGESFGGAYHLHDSARYGSLRGVMTWSINWDAAHSFQFSEALRACLDALP